MANTDMLPNAFMGETVELTLKVSELVDLIECGTVVEIETGYEPDIVGELRTLFSRLVQDTLEAADQV